MSDTDLQLLERYTRDRAEDAFTELVRRHVDLVHSAALRQVRSPQLAKEIAQSVFADLARDADKLDSDTILTAWLNKIAHLKQRLKDMPDKAIPELQFLTENDWGNAAWSADLGSDDGVRQALSKLREEAQNSFLNEMMKVAIKKYLTANNGVLPSDLTQLKPYFDVQVSDAMLQRYALVQSGKPDIHEKLVETIAPPVDEEYDSYHEISISGAGGSEINMISQQVSAAMKAFGQANNGQTPTEASQLTPFLNQPIDLAKIQKYLNKFAASSNP